MKRWLLTVMVAAAASSFAQTFVNPVIPHGADPSVVQWQGKFVSVQSCGRDGGPAICLRVAETLPGLGKAPSVAVWHAPKNGPNSQQVWAPQVDVLGGELYIYYAAQERQDQNGDNDHRLFALVPQDRAKPLGAWVEGDTGAPGGQLVTDWKSAWAIDPDVFTASDGRLYLLYACRQDNSGTDFGRSQSICMARMRDPLHLDVDPRTGKSVVELSQPRQAWERRGWPTQEGPFGFTHDGVDYILYSASFSGNPDQYAEAMLVNDHPPQPQGWDGMLNPASWRKVGPIFDGHHAAYGTASSVLVPSTDGATLWHVYHGTDCMLNCERTAGKTWRDRSDRAQPAGWSHGELVLGYPVDFANTDGTGKDVPVEARGKDWPVWGAAFGDAAEGDGQDGRVLGEWTRDGDAIVGGTPDGVAQNFYQANPNLQRYTVVAHLKRIEGSGAFGVYAAYVDRANYVAVLLSGLKAELRTRVRGVERVQELSVPDNYPDDEATIAVEVNDGAFRLRINGSPEGEVFRGVLSEGQNAVNGSNGQAGVLVDHARVRVTSFHVLDGAPADSRKGGGLIALRNVATRRNLDNACAGGCGGKTKADVALITTPPAAPYPATISSTQLWELRERPGGFALVSVLSGMCAEARGESVVQEACSKEDAQAWTVLPREDGFVLQAHLGGLVMTPEGGGIALKAEHGASEQRWTLVMQ